MARSVNEINITNWTSLGNTAQINQYSFDVEIKWTRDNGSKGQHSSTRVFPNSLGAMPLKSRRYFVEQMLLAVARVELGIDSWEDYE